MSRKLSVHGRKLKREAERKAAEQAQTQAQEQERLAVLNTQMIEGQIRDCLASLRTSAGIHAFTGQSAAMVANQAGRLCFVVCHAAQAAGLADAPEVSILRGTAESLGDIVASPDSLERLRGSIQSGLAAADRLMPRLSPWALALASLELDTLLSLGQGMGTSDIEKILRQPSALIQE